MTYEEYIALEKQKKTAKRRLVSKVEGEVDGEENNRSDKEAVASGEIKTSSDEIDFSVAKLYIIPEMREYAEHSLKRGASPIKAALYCVLIFAFFVALVLTMPSLLTLINNILG